MSNLPCQAATPRSAVSGHEVVPPSCGLRRVVCRVLRPEVRCFFSALVGMRIPKRKE